MIALSKTFTKIKSLEINDNHERSTISRINNFQDQQLTEDFRDYVKPLIRDQPSCIILHVGTNNLRSEEPDSTAEKILSVKELVNKMSPRAEVIISSLTTRTDRISGTTSKSQRGKQHFVQS